MAEWNGYYCTVLNYNIHTDMIIFCPEESEAAVSDCLPVHSSPGRTYTARHNVPVNNIQFLIPCLTDHSLATLYSVHLLLETDL